MKSKKILSTVLLIALLMVTATSSFASDNGYVNSGDYLYNLSIYPPEGNTGIGLDSVDRPSITKDLSSEGSYDFKGTSHTQDLYTDYDFNGQTSYSVTVKNNSTSDLTVNVKSFWHSYKKVTVDPGETVTFTASGMDKSDKIYILFKGSPMDFSGSIS